MSRRIRQRRLGTLFLNFSSKAAKVTMPASLAFSDQPSDLQMASLNSGVSVDWSGGSSLA